MKVYDIYFNVGRYDTNALVVASNKRHAFKLMREFMRKDDLVDYYAEQYADYSDSGKAPVTLEGEVVTTETLDTFELHDEHTRLLASPVGTIHVYDQGT